ncbi:hypothetical protein PV326_011903 [Microctonus aethiopoides]|uniref:Sodium channel protein n=1 Tax=Microctonus aethiopoides TaxID=144406 RepID=A0AA39KR07_9HYME|nr:hypothetical protein PV326_011903 [Microctonus aethiopoides]KAK0170680.1 hypothetical protein PV328_008502 [Microctonus aethiopoides]
MFDKKEKTLKTNKQKQIISWNFLKRYLANSSIHGVKYLIDDNRHWSERVFWVIACSLSWWGCGILISGTIKDFITNKVDLTKETNFLKWEIEFPSIHLCFYFSGRAKDYAANITGIDRRKASTMIRLTKWATMGYESSIAANISSEQFEILGEYIKPQCTDVLGKCIWNDEELDCCEMFTPIETNIGQCLSFNSVHTNYSQNQHSSKFFMNHHKQMAKVTLYLKKTAFWNTSRDFFNVLLTSTIEYPARSIGKERYLSAQWIKPKPTIWDFHLMPTHNDNGILSMPYNERHCRFHSEINNFRLLKSYSYHGCLVESQMRRSQSLCGCVSHLYPSSKQYRTCNYTELKCVLNNRKEIVDKNDDDCLPECEEIKFTLFENLSNDGFDLPNWAVTKLIFNMLPSPSIRYNRYRVRSLLDVIISTGSTLGLFSGASVLSLIELFYWFFLRHDDIK